MFQSYSAHSSRQQVGELRRKAQEDNLEADMQLHSSIPLTLDQNNEGRGTNEPGLHTSGECLSCTCKYKPFVTL